jgi:serine protease Do
MRFPKSKATAYLAFLGIAPVVLGGAGFLPAQRQPEQRIVQIGAGGPHMGIEMEDVTAETMAKLKLSAETGVVVRSVEKGSPAEAAHLQENDVILEYAGMTVFSTWGLARMVQETPVGRTVNLTVSREGKKMNLSVKIAEGTGGATSGAFKLIAPDTLIQRYGINPPASGQFQFQVPRWEGRTFSFTLPFRPQLGVTVQTLTEQMGTFLGVAGKGGVLVTEVAAGSAAASSLRAGDVIVSIDGRSVAAPEDLTRELARKSAGDKVELKIIRDKKEMAVTVELPKSQGAIRGIKARPLSPAVRIVRAGRRHASADETF